jgi:uncharacterized protein (TIGR03089 family)
VPEKLRGRGPATRKAGVVTRADTPTALLQAAVARDGTRPLVTYYDDATGERTELSLTTTANWVAKTSGLLIDEIGLAPGGRVALLLPPHWQTLVWLSGCWAAGAIPVLDGDPRLADVVVTGPDDLERAVATNGEVVALSLRPLGLPFADPLPAGVLDYATAVPGQADVFQSTQPVRPETLALVLRDEERTAGQLVARAREQAEGWGLAGGERLLVPADRFDESWLLAAVLVPLVVDGSAVLCRNLGSSSLVRRLVDERVDAVVDGFGQGGLPPGVPVLPLR